MQNILPILLFILWAGALFGGFAFGAMNAENTHRIPRPLRMLSSVALTLAAWTVFLSADGAFRDLALWTAIGMSFGLLGDLFMADLLIHGDSRVLAGMGAFGVGHIAYIVGFLGYAGTLPDNVPTTRAVIWLVWMVVAVGLWYVIVWRQAAEKSMPIQAALPYSLLLASTAGVAMGMATLSAGFWVVTLGAALFLASDLLLALQLFNGMHFRGIGDVVWLLYGPAQMLIVFGVAVSF